LLSKCDRNALRPTATSKPAYYLSALRKFHCAFRLRINIVSLVNSERIKIMYAEFT